MTDIDLRAIKFLEGFNLSFHILTLAYSKLHKTCARIPQDGSAFHEAMWRCWSFVDTVHRIREMAQAVPRLSRKSPELVTFLRETAIAEKFRHYNQHLRAELSKRILDPFPVWGSLSWVDPEDEMCSHVAVAGVLNQDTKLTSCVFDKVERRWVSKVCLGLAGLSFNFDPLHDACQTFAAFILPRLQQHLGNRIQVKPQVPVVSIRVVPGREPMPNHSYPNSSGQ